MTTSYDLLAMQEARQVLEPFRDWLVRQYGVQAWNADAIVAVVVRAIWEHTGEDDETPDPLEALRNPYLNRATYSKIKSALTRYYTWQLTLPPSEANHEWARRQLNSLVNLPGPLLEPYTRPSSSRSEPLPREEFERLLHRLPGWARRNGSRTPWAAPVISILVRTALLQSEIMSIEREDLVRAWANGKTETFQVVHYPRKRRRIKTIPIGLIWTDAEKLIHWPWEWTRIAEVVSPSSSARSGNVKTAVKNLSRACGSFGKDEMGWEKWPGYRIRLSSLRWMLDKLNGDWIALGQVSGISETTLRKMPHLVRE